MTYSADEFPPGSAERIDFAGRVAATACCNPEDVIEDWGHYDEDYTPAEQAQSWEHTDVDTPIEIELTAVNKFNALYHDD